MFRVSSRGTFLATVLVSGSFAYQR
jgi:hypothetical protein